MYKIFLNLKCQKYAKKEVIYMFPDTFIEASEETEKISDSGIDFLFDYGTGQHIMKGSVLKECNDLQTVRQYIQNVLRTKANVYGVYTKNSNEVFGISIYDYIGLRTIPMGYINSELKREVTKFLLKHPSIKEVNEWKSKRVKRGLEISFTVVLNDGSVIKTDETVSSEAVI